MRASSIMQHMITTIEHARSAGELQLAMDEVVEDLGFRHYAIAQHANRSRVSEGPPCRLHNYPPTWARTYDERAISVHDPVRRACRVTAVGFAWQDLGSLVCLTEADRRTLSLGRDHGLTDGITIPANIPGELSGSCTFAGAKGGVIARDCLPIAQTAGAYAFNRLRGFWLTSKMMPRERLVGLTDRQRECVIWVARGKSDWEISRILGVSEETITRHVKAARDAYKVQKRTLLAVRALADGTISFDDILSP